MNTKSIKFLFGVVLCGAMAIPVVCSASAAMGPPWILSTDSPEAFSEQAATLLKDMEPDGRYGELGPATRRAVAKEIETIEGLLQLRGSAAELSDREQVQLMNAQERIRAQLTRNEAGRLICTWEPRTGSNFKIQICMTKSQRAEVRRNAQNAFQNGMMFAQRGGTN